MGKYVPKKAYNKTPIPKHRNKRIKIKDRVLKKLPSRDSATENFVLTMLFKLKENTLIDCNFTILNRVNKRRKERKNQSTVFSLTMSSLLINVD